MVSGTLSLGGDLYDVTNGKKIYDGVAGKFEASVLPYEKGDLTSDWASSSYSEGYYTAVDAGDVKSGVAFGRGSSGSGCLNGTATPADIRLGKTTDANCDGTLETGTLKSLALIPESSVCIEIMYGNVYVNGGIVGMTGNQFCSLFGLTCAYKAMAKDTINYHICRNINGIILSTFGSCSVTAGYDGVYMGWQYSAAVWCY